jgi:hypothetical protein
MNGIFRAVSGRVAGVVCGLVIAGSAVAENRNIVIQRDLGGDVGLYEIKVEVFRKLGYKVIIDGTCASACTLFTTLPPGQVCATKRAALKFHRFVMAKRARNAAYVEDRENRMLMAKYPPGIRNWIRRNGGLTRQTLTMRATEINRHIRRCT